MPKKIRTSPGEIMMMVDQGMTQLEMSKHFGCNNSTLSKLIKRYREMGYNIPKQKMGRRLGVKNVPKKPFFLELYELIDEHGGFTEEED